MELNLTHQAAGYRQQHKRTSIWKKITMVLASVVVFCTTYALILPAITMEQDAICGLEAHTHEESCYSAAPSVAVTELFCDRDTLVLHSHDESCLNENDVPACGYADFVIHQHDAVCYDADGQLQCALPEIEVHAHGEGCWQPPHTHTETCYTAIQGELLCHETEGLPHAHGETCYTPRQNLICTLPEVVGHTHSESCKTVTTTLVCELTEEAAHAHDETCLDENGVLACTKTETAGHAHEAACYETTEALTCILPEQEGHSHGEGCYETVSDLTCQLSDTEPHVHTDGCYQWTPQLTCEELTAEEGAQATLTCRLDEIVAHTHDETCLTDGILTCGKTEVLAHVHQADACYQVTIQESQQQLLSCGQQEHTHAETCYPVQEETEGDLSAGDSLTDIRYCGIAAHSHVEACYGADGTVMCTMTEHEHDWLCDLAPSDPTAVETQEEWESGLPELTGDMASDLIAVAESQLGYEESAVNYILTEEEELLYYSRYADWWSYGEDPYGDWNAKFVAFCLDYAGISSNLVPQESEAAAWPDTLYHYDLWYENDGEFLPIAADLVFFDTDGDGTADRAGIISAVSETEGTFDAILERRGMVQKVTYDLDDTDILGYARIPGNEPATVEANLTEAAQNVIDLIDALPTYDEYVAQLEAYYDADDMEGEEAYATAVTQQVKAAYEAYCLLSPEEQVAVTNADKLMALENIWSAEILIDEIVSDKPTKIASASTKDFIELNLYDYNSNINTNYNSNNAWPGFQWNGGAYNLSSTYNRNKIDFIDFGNSLITDFAYAGSNLGKATTAQNVGNQGGNINAIVEYPDNDYANKPVGMSNGTEVLGRNLTTAGYPWVTGAGSMVDYFNNSAFATKMNTSSIDGLFQINSITGAYYYNSRWNHAQYGNNEFTLYEDIITPNFITYPFGNFLPLNDITNSSNATQVSKIQYVGGYGNVGYVQQIINDLIYSSDYNSNPTKKQLLEMLVKYRDDLKTVSTTNGNAWTTWNAKDAIYDYIGNGPTDDTSPITDALLEKMYNIDWDVKTNFFFGMEMKMNFMMPKDGLTGKDNGNNTTGTWKTNSAGDYYLTGSADGISDYPMTFYFTGDDDVWVYIDGVLFLDLSGIHRHVGGEIDFVDGEVRYYALEPATGDVSSTPYATYSFADLLTAAGKSTDVLNSNGTFKDYSTHSFNFYYMERGSGSSVCRINFNFPLLRQNSITVTKETSPTDNTTEVLGSPDYFFSVIKKDGSGLVVPVGTAYDILDSGGNTVGAGTVDQYGMFKLKAGQTAVFSVTENSGEYYVQELIPEPYRPQYGETVGVNDYSSRYNDAITWTTASRPWTFPALKEAVPENAVNPKLGPPLEEGGEGVVWYGFSSNNEDASDSQTFLFRMNNHVDVDNLGSLRIQKQLIEVDDFVQLLSLEEPTFNMTVKLDELKLPVGTAYTVHYSNGTTSNKTVTTAGVVVVPAGGYVVIDNILAGTEYTVTEQDDGLYYITYQYPDETGQTTTNTDKASGVVAVDTQVAILVINSEVSVKGELTINKTVVNPDGIARDYTFQIVQVDDANEPVEGGLNETITVSGVTITGSAGFQLGYAEADIDDFPATYYYRISEVNDKDDVLDNDQVFLVEVQVTKTDGALNAQVLNRWSCSNDENGMLLKEAVSSITFQNTIAGSLTLSKQVVGAVPEGGFTFNIALKDANGDPVTGTFDAVFHQQDGTTEKTTVSSNAEGVITLNAFNHGEKAVINGIPIGTTWTITETNADGYVVTYTVNNGASQTGAKSDGDIIVGNTTVEYTNTAMYELPETGGGGVAKILTCGGLLALMPCLWLLRRQRYRGRRVTGG